MTISWMTEKAEIKKLTSHISCNGSDEVNNAIMQGETGNEGINETQCEEGYTYLI